jgi:DNA-binding transcriptional MerR regulator
MKRAGGRRFYRPHDLAVLKGVRRLLHDEGYTIKGVQRLHREQGVARLVAAGEGEIAPAAPDLASAPAGELAHEARARLTAMLAELETAKARLDDLLGR